MQPYHSRLPLDELFLSRLALSDPTVAPDRKVLRRPVPILTSASPRTANPGTPRSSSKGRHRRRRWQIWSPGLALALSVLASMNITSALGLVG